MDNEHDTPLILTEGYSNKVANGIAEGILAYLNIEKKGTSAEEAKQETSQATVETRNKIGVKYQVYANGRWYSDITNYNEQNDMGYAGVFGQAISRFQRQYCAEMKQMQES